LNKNYTKPQIDIIVSLSEYCVGSNLNTGNNTSGYTQVEGEDIFDGE